ncbi:MAG: hypothetical protein R3F65_33315 [bacterium]
MLRRLMARKIEAFEREWGYDMSYAREILAVGAGPLVTFMRATAVGGYRGGLPDAVWHAARVAAIVGEDCGPCAQLAVSMAERAGVDAGLLRAVVAGDDAALADDVRVAVGFVRAAAARSGECDGLREAAKARWGAAGVVALTYALLASRMYPTVKYALGYGKTCMRVEVGGVAVAAWREAAA